MYALISFAILVFLFLIKLYRSHRLDKIITALNASNWKVILNASNCGFCLMQIRFLGDRLNDVNVIHCDDAKNRDICLKYPEQPVWVGNGRSVKGAKISVEAFEKMLVQEN